MRILKDWGKAILEQIFVKGEELPRTGKIVLTRHAFDKLKEWNLELETIKLTYEVGDKTNKGKGVYQVVRKYKYYPVGLWLTEEYRPVKGTKEVEKMVLVITCWKGGVKA